MNLLASIAALSLAGAASAAPEKVTYEEHVVPILRNRCFNCHNAEKSKGDLDVSTFDALLIGGSSGEVVAAGDPDGSRFYGVMTHAEEPKMPPNSAKMPDAELEVIKKWIAGGLLKNSGSTAKVAKKPAVNLSLSSAPVGKPSGPPPMPGDLPIEPITKTSRANAVTAMAASPWAPLLAIGGQKQLLLYQADTLDLLGVLPFPEGLPNVVKFSRNGKLLLAAGGHAAKSGRVVIYDVATGKRITEVGDELDAVLAADISADQKFIALGGSSRLVKVFAVDTGEVEHSIKKHTDWVTSIEFSPDGVLLASGDRSGGLHVWETDSGNEFHGLRGHQSQITSVRWRDDSNILASGSEDGTIRLWEMNNGTQVKNWPAHGGGVTAVAYAHDGRLVSTGRDRVSKLWDGNGKQLAQFEALNDIPTQIAITHDGQKIFAADWTGEIRAFSAPAAKRVGSFYSNPPTAAERLELGKKDIVRVEAEVKSLAAAAEQTKKSADDAAAALAAAKKLLAEGDSIVKAAEKKIADTKPAIEKLSKEHDKAKADAEAAKAALAKAEAESAKLKAPLEAAQKAQKQTENALAAREANVKNRKAAFDGAKQASEKAPADTKLKDALTKAKADLDSATKEVTDSKTAMQAAATEAKKQAGALEPHRLAVEKENASLAALRKKINEQGNSLKAMRESLQQMRTQAEATKKAVADAKKSEPAKTEAAKKAAEQAKQTKELAEAKAQELAALRGRVDRLQLAVEKTTASAAK